MSISSPNIQCRRASGFTLLEVLVALSILALSLGVLMQSFGRASQTASVTEDFRRALMTAESQLALATTSMEGNSFNDAGVVDDRYSWNVTSEQFEQTESTGRPLAKNPSLVTIEVSWNDNDRLRMVSLSTIRLGVNGQQRR